ncbi:MAG: hypothetical protein V2A58_05625, partial [Planctomycetota bacterium]
FSTVSGTNLYLHMKAYPRGEAVFAGLASPVKAVELLPGGRRLPFTQRGDVLTITGLPVKSPDPIMPVLRVRAGGPIRAC